MPIFQTKSDTHTHILTRTEGGTTSGTSSGIDNIFTRAYRTHITLWLVRIVGNPVDGWMEGWRDVWREKAF